MNRVSYSDPNSGASNPADELLKAAKEELVQIKSQSQIIQKQTDDIQRDRDALDRARQALSQDRQELIDKLSKISSLTKDEAKKELLEVVDKEMNIICLFLNNLALGFNLNQLLFGRFQKFVGRIRSPGIGIGVGNSIHKILSGNG